MVSIEIYPRSLCICALASMKKELLWIRLDLCLSLLLPSLSPLHCQINGAVCGAPSVPASCLPLHVKTGGPSRGSPPPHTEARTVLLVDVNQKCPCVSVEALRVPPVPCPPLPRAPSPQAMVWDGCTACLSLCQGLSQPCGTRVGVTLLHTESICFGDPLLVDSRA